MEVNTLNIPEKEVGRQRVVIIGAGFAGLTMATRLVKYEYQIVLIDKNNHHQFQPLFYQVAMAGLEPSSIIFPLRKSFQNKKNVHIRVAKFTDFDAEHKVLHTDQGSCSYDLLIFAHGATTNFYGNERIEAEAFGLKSISESLDLRNSILADYEKAVLTPDYYKRQGYIDIVIVGGGPTGVELAGAMSEMKRFIVPKDYVELNYEEIDIYLVQSGDRLLQGMSDKASKDAERFLLDMGVIVEKNVRVTDVSNGDVSLSDGRKIQAGKVVWAAGIKGNDTPGIREEVIKRGNRIEVNEYHEVVGYDSVYALGDIACLKEGEEYGKGHPQVAQVAIQQAKNLANNICKNRRKPFKYKDKGSMATVGRNKAVVDLPLLSFSGFFAWAVWLVVHLFSLIGTKNKLFVFLNWLWNYFTYDQSLRLILRAENKKKG